ncbi:uncharacterized protein Dyak_GE22392 [Drosophila yakuba]|uniref:Nuclear receptor domain-containing protein n=1 Tax=Drosophila yakuba TaxID=7245 RepID=A0A0R1E3B4_DROYA|nr:uncharacterized protein Dyak_GE22392 [Drosophila yakuba]
MMNQDNPYAMNQTCKVCGEPAAGFHFGAFTCEGCKSFFGRSYNNLSSISDCKNNGECIINKKNRTACKACRLKKCLMVGMSKSGSRYGRRSNWFKIHCLLQEQQQQAVAAMAAHHNSQQAGGGSAGGSGGVQGMPNGVKGMSGVPPPAAAAAALGMLGHPGGYPGLYAVANAGGSSRSKEELMMLGLDGSVEYGSHKHPVVASPSVSSPDSHNSDSSVEVSSVRGNPLLHLGGKSNSGGSSSGADGSHSGGGGGGGGGGVAPGRPPQMRKDMSPFLPLPFPGLASMPVMPPPAFLPKLPPHSKQDYSISALVTPNSESGRERVKSRQNEEDDEARVDGIIDGAEHDDEEEDLVVSMTPPHSPAQQAEGTPVGEHPSPSPGQDNPIDLSMKTTGSSLSSESSSPEIEPETEISSDLEKNDTDDEDEDLKVTPEEEISVRETEDHESEEENTSTETAKTSIEKTHNNNNSISNNNNNNNNNNSILSDSEASETIKRKLDELIEVSSENGKRLRLEAPVKVATSNALDLTTKV